jgi:hypothetical protein
MPGDLGLRWEAPAGGLIVFAFPRASSITDLDASAAGYAVASDLLFLWTTHVRLAPSRPPGFARASGGKLWMRVPGYSARPTWHQWSGPVLVDPAHLVSVRTEDPVLPVVTDPAGRDWIRLEQGWAAELHTSERP